LTEAWEEELNDTFGGNLKSGGAASYNWKAIKQLAQELLKRDSKTFSLSQVNQYNIITNFATLQVKGLSAMKAWQCRDCEALARGKGRLVCSKGPCVGAAF
jgi:hypothetical protein